MNLYTILRRMMSALFACPNIRHLSEMWITGIRICMYKCPWYVEVNIRNSTLKSDHFLQYQLSLSVKTQSSSKGHKIQIVLFPLNITQEMQGERKRKYWSQINYEINLPHSTSGISGNKVHRRSGLDSSRKYGNVNDSEISKKWTEANAL
uniref:Uncharacterized protein n=1 Tax=Onchocerca volvulus TaxID=6282 RepID=A0A8R1Y126_ONCVO